MTINKIDPDYPYGYEPNSEEAKRLAASKALRIRIHARNVGSVPCDDCMHYARCAEPGPELICKAYERYLSGLPITDKHPKNPKPASDGFFSGQRRRGSG